MNRDKATILSQVQPLQTNASPQLNPVDKLSNLVPCPKKALSMKCHIEPPKGLIGLKIAYRQLREAARCCREAFGFLRAAGPSFGYCIKNYSTYYWGRLRRLILAFLPQQARLSRSKAGLKEALPCEQ